MFDTCLLKQSEVRDLFPESLSKEDRYHKIIQLGKDLAPLDEKKRIAENLVKGCQSMTYLTCEMKEGLVFFEASSDAFISAGLAALLIKVYNGESPETILKCPPDFLEELGISASLTPNRANGLYSMHLRMKQDALKILINQ